MTPKQVRVMAAYFEATERLADATDDLINASKLTRSGLVVNCTQFEEAAAFCLQLYRQARADYENL